MEWKLEVVPVPVSDVDRAKAFYADQVGFVVDLEIPLGADVRTVQLTPLGSGCSIYISNRTTATPVGSLDGLQLVVPDIEAARTARLAGGVKVSPVRHMVDGEWREGHGGNWNPFLFFADPDGNGWAVQERPDE